MKNVLLLFLLAALPMLSGILIPYTGPYSSELSVEFAIPVPVLTSSIINPEHLDGAFTGGFGEQTCHSCHFDFDKNMDGGGVTLDGLNDSYKPGKTYELTLTVESEHLKNGGFQMTSRFPDGSRAGKFDWTGDHIMLTPDISDEVQYLQHTSVGTRPTAERRVEWSFTWEAPVDGPGEVLMHIAANAGNDDDSAFGDRIYLKEINLKPD